jgi:glutathione S-transferase
MNPVSNTSRPIRLLIMENKLPVDEQIVDFNTGEHLGESYLKLNPNGLVPTLVDGDFILTESSAIMKYLADKFDLAAYPKDLQKRARVNEMMDWFNTGFYPA